MPNWGKLLSHHGHAACPGWADLVSDTCPIYSHLRSSANACNSIHLTIPLISKPSRQLPDNRQTVNFLFVRILQQKTRQSDSFSEILAFAEIQRYGQLLLIKKHWDSSIVILSWETGKSMMFRLCSFHTLHKTPSSAQPHQVPSELPQSPHTCRRDLPL